MEALTIPKHAKHITDIKGISVTQTQIQFYQIKVVDSCIYIKRDKTKSTLQAIKRCRFFIMKSISVQYQYLYC